MPVNAFMDERWPFDEAATADAKLMRRIAESICIAICSRVK
jgi:hypothetical protein